MGEKEKKSGRIKKNWEKREEMGKNVGKLGKFEKKWEKIEKKWEKRGEIGENEEK